MASGLFALPSADLIPAATVSMTNADTDYPAANAKNDDPADTARSTTTSTVVTITVASATPEAVAVINTNATSIALTNGAGMASQALTIPSRTADGKQRNGWKDLRGVADRTSTTFTLTMSKSGSEKLEFGRIVLVTALHDLIIHWGGSRGPRFELIRPNTVDIVTKGGTLHRRVSPTEQRTLEGRVSKHASLATLQALEALAAGAGKGFLLVPESDVNDAWFVTMPHGVRWQRQWKNVTELTVMFEELVMGLPPALT